MKISLLTTLFFLCITLHGFSQFSFYKKQSQTLTFKEMQKQFSDFKKEKDLKKTKGWKYFKRWEQELQLHTDGSGKPVDAAIYISELNKETAKKNSSLKSSSTVNWLPTGSNVLPINQTGYAENGIGRMNCIAFHPTDASTFFVGVAQGGVWKTTNNGQSWTPLTDQLPITRISDIAIDPNNASVMYVSVCDFEYIGFGLKLNGRKRNTHYGLGVYKTIDGGLNWSATGLSFQLTDGDASLIRKVIVHPNNSNKLVACGTSGMYVSNDAGTTWNKTMDSLFWDLQIDPVSPNILYAATGWVYNANEGNAAIYKSNDFGNTWTMLNTGIPSTNQVQRIKLAIAPSNHNVIYAAAVDTLSGYYGMYKSVDAGITWNYQAALLNIFEWDQGNGTGGQGTYDLGLLVDAANENKVYTGGINIWGSTDGGVNFNPISHWTTSYGPTLHCDIHFIAQQASTGNFYVCSDGGLYRTPSLTISSWASANSGALWPTQWTHLNDGLQVSSFYRVSSSRNQSSLIVAGAQDNGSFFYDGTQWNTVFGGDGMDNYINPTDNSVICSSQYGNFGLASDGINYFNINPNVNSEVAEWTSPITSDSNNHLYAGFYNVTMSSDGGNSWSPISNFTPTGIAYNEISTLAVSPSNASVIYAAHRVRYELGLNGDIMYTNNAGNTWTNITLGTPDTLYYTSLDVDHNNPNIVYLSCGGMVAGTKVFKSTNAGLTWQNISYNLPNLPANCIKAIANSNKLLLASDIGVYLFDPIINQWNICGSGFPNVIATDIEIDDVANKIYVSTFGRGIWEAPLNEFVGIKNITSKFELYPTLNRGNFNIELEKNAFLYVYDIMGKMVYTSSLKAGSNEIKLSLLSGKYFAKIMFDQHQSVKTFIIEDAK
jgi:photosystem II stability/assembly factor-like uncharacterized protein